MNKPIRCYGCQSKEIGICNCTSIYTKDKYLKGKRIGDFIAHYEICKQIEYLLTDPCYLNYKKYIDNEVIEDIFYEIWVSLELYHKKNKTLEEVILDSLEKDEGLPYGVSSAIRKALENAICEKTNEIIEF